MNMRHYLHYNIILEAVRVIAATVRLIFSELEALAVVLVGFLAARAGSAGSRASPALTTAVNMFVRSLSVVIICSQTLTIDRTWSE